MSAKLNDIMVHLKNILDNDKVIIKTFKKKLALWKNVCAICLEEKT